MLLLSVLFFFCPLRPPAKRCDEHGCAISAAPLASSAPSPTPATWPSTARTAARASSPAPPLRPAPAPPASPPSRPAGSVSTSRSVTRPATVSFPHTPAAHATHTAHLLCTHTQRHHHPDRDVVNRPVMVCTSLLHRHAYEWFALLSCTDMPVQCHSSTGSCWCVDPTGAEMANTRMSVRSGGILTPDVCMSVRSAAPSPRQPNHCLRSRGLLVVHSCGLVGRTAHSLAGDTMEHLSTHGSSAINTFPPPPLPSILSMPASTSFGVRPSHAVDHSFDHSFDHSDASIAVMPVR